MRQDLEIVLIEDNEDDAEKMMGFLKKTFSNNIRHINDGAEAVQFLLFETNSQPKLILLDLVLPSVDGIELYKMIKAEPENRQLSVVILISSAATKTYLDSLDIHPDGYLMKPTYTDIPVWI